MTFLGDSRQEDGQELRDRDSQTLGKGACVCPQHIATPLVALTKAYYSYFP
jgi:hypothetical protein